MKIALVSVDNIKDNTTWSKYTFGINGAAYWITKELEKLGHQITYITLEKRYSWITKTKFLFYRYLLRKSYYRGWDSIVYKDYSKQATEQIANSDCDIVISINSVLPIAYLKCKQPIVLWIDAVLTSLIDLYPGMTNLCQENIDNAYRLEKDALDNCSKVVYSCLWSLCNAKKTYDIPCSKVSWIRFGANLPDVNYIWDIQKLISSRQHEVCNLVFIGTEWERKGGPLAIQITEELNRLGLPSKLVIVGCEPETTSEYVNVIGFLNKDSKVELGLLESILEASHFLLLPSLADCNPHVIPEANSFGVPCIGSKVGGLTEYIKEGTNGYTLPLEAGYQEYANCIKEAFEGDYSSLALDSFMHYESRHRWETLVEQFSSELTITKESSKEYKDYNNEK